MTRQSINEGVSVVLTHPPFVYMPALKSGQRSVVDYNLMTVHDVDTLGRMGYTASHKVIDNHR